MEFQWIFNGFSLDLYRILEEHLISYARRGRLKAWEPPEELFKLLCGVSHPFEYRDPDAGVHLNASVPVIQLHEGELQRITFNNRSAAALAPEFLDLEEYYKAWALFDRLANSEAYSVRVLLHFGRNAFKSAFKEDRGLVPSRLT